MGELLTKEQVNQLDEELRNLLDSVPGIQYVLSAMVLTEESGQRTGYSGFDVLRAADEEKIRAMFHTMFSALLGNLPPDAPEAFREQVRRTVEIWPLPDYAIVGDPVPQ